MAHPPRAQNPAGSVRAQAAALTAIRITTGIYLLFTGVSRARWLLDSAPLAAQLSMWSAQATPFSHWYLERMIPGVPVFARLVPLGEMAGGLALIAGFWTRLAAGALFLLLLQAHLAAGAMFSYSYLMRAGGLPLLGSLFGLTVGGGRLPLSVKR